MLLTLVPGSSSSSHLKEACTTHPLPPYRVNNVDGLVRQLTKCLLDRGLVFGSSRCPSQSIAFIDRNGFVIDCQSLFDSPLLYSPDIDGTKLRFDLGLLVDVEQVRSILKQPSTGKQQHHAHLGSGANAGQRQSSSSQEERAAVSGGGAGPSHNPRSGVSPASLSTNDAPAAPGPHSKERWVTVDLHVAANCHGPC